MKKKRHHIESVRTLYSHYNEEIKKKGEEVNETHTREKKLRENFQPTHHTRTQEKERVSESVRNEYMCYVTQYTYIALQCST